jgi:uncharacterized membrane protein
VNELPYEVIEKMKTAKSLDAQARAAADSRALAFAAYTAALDREASASRSYEHQVNRLMRDGRSARGDVPKSPHFFE